MRNYTQLTQEQRYQIKALLNMGHNQKEIARAIDVSNSTISRELKRNRGLRGYRPRQAQIKAIERRKHKVTRRITEATWNVVEERLRFDLSPEQISEWLTKYELQSVSHETIYQYIYDDKRAGGNLYKHLRCQKKRRKRVGTYDRRGIIPNRESIETRPKVVETRSRLGDWEIDTMIGKGHRGAVVTLTERRSRFTLLRTIRHKSAELVGKTVTELLNWVEHIYTITSDNGKEFANHQSISATLSAKFFFAHPYASWERGTNENTNGLIRQYIPKNRDLDTITTEEELWIMDRLNLRPRKCLDFSTPFEIFFGLTIALTS